MAIDQHSRIPSVHDWADARSAEIAAGISSLPVDETISSQIGKLMRRACDSDVHTLDTMAEYVSAAHGLHAAAAKARVNGNEEWARDLHGLAQVFLHYAIADIAAIAAMTRTYAPNQSGLNAVH